MRTFSKYLHSVYNIIEAFIFPQFCLNCDTELNSKAILFCPECLNKLEPTDLGNWIDRVTTNTYLDYACSVFWFNDTLHDIIHQIKYNDYKLLLNKIVEAFPEAISSDIQNLSIDALVPIPLHKVKFRERGFNQSDIIAVRFAENVKVPVRNKLIKRTKWTQTQTALDVKGRLENTQKAFQVSGGCKNKRLLLIDDVLTSGATANACAAQLKENGADWVGILTLATPVMKK